MSKNIRWLALALVVVVTGALVFAQSKSGERPEAATIVKMMDEPQTIILENKDTHWTDDHLKALNAERRVDQSVYLSAVQLVELERERDKAYKALPYLETLASRIPEQPLKNAVRRLMVDIYLEEGDWQNADKQLKIIIDESLLQM